MQVTRADSARLARGARLVPALTCSTHVWVGLPYLNRFHDESPRNNVCTPGPVYIGANTFGTLTLAATGLPSLQVNDFSSSSAQIEVQGGGTLNLVGSGTVPISIAAVGNAQRLGRQPCWRTIKFDDNSSGTLSFLHLSNGGCAGVPGTIEINASGKVSLADTTIDSSHADDIRLDDNAVATLQQNNLGPVPGGAFGVENNGWSSGQSRIGATCNWWGAKSGPAGTGTGTGVPVSAGVTFSPG